MLVIFPSTQMLSVLYLIPTCYVFKLWHISVGNATVSLLRCSKYLFHNYAVVPEWHNFWVTSCSVNPVAQTLYYDQVVIAYFCLTDVLMF